MEYAITRFPHCGNINAVLAEYSKHISQAYASRIIGSAPESVLGYGYLGAGIIFIY
jgi:hypothetical protein